MDISLKAREMVIEEMDRQNITIYRLAVLSGVDPGNSHRFFYRKPKRSFRPSLDAVSRYFRALGLSLSDLEKQIETHQPETVASHEITL